MSIPTESSGPFVQSVEAALEHFAEPEWLGAHSPLAEPFMLGSALNADASTAAPAGRGRVLQKLMRSTLHGMPDSLQELKRLLQITYVSPSLTRTRRGYAVEMGMSAATYFRRRKEAVEQYASALVGQFRPGLRMEAPRGHPLVGRQDELAGTWEHLRAGQVVAITGVSGQGKTTLGAALAKRWEQQSHEHRPAERRPGEQAREVFWYTLRPGVNDQLGSLLFGLGLFLSRRGPSGLWLQLLAKPGHIDPDLALSLLRDDLAAQAPTPLLCFDEIDLLRPADNDEGGRIRLRSFIDALLAEARQGAPVLLLGQQVLFTPDRHLVLSGLTPDEADEILIEHGVALSTEERVQLHAATLGNPLLVRLFANLHQSGDSASVVLDRMPTTPTLDVLLDRIGRRMTDAERAVFQLLAVHSRPASESAIAAAFDAAGMAAALNALIERGLVLRDAAGGVQLPAALRDAAYGALKTEARSRLHLRAAEICSARAAYTDAAQHWVQAGQPALAVWTWYTHRELEVQQGQSEAALAMFRAVSPEGLSNADDRRVLALLRGELLRARGDSRGALDDMSVADWSSASALSVRGQYLRGDLLDDLDRIDDALAAFRAGLAANDAMAGQAARLHQRMGALQARRFADLGAARAHAAIARTQVEFLSGDIEDEAGNYAQARAHFEEALRIATASDQKLNMAVAHSFLAHVAARTSDLDSAQPHFEQARALYVALGEHARAQQERCRLAWALIAAGRNDEAVLELRQAQAYFERTQQGYWIAMCAANMAEACVNLDKLSEAEAQARRALEQQEARVTPYAQCTLGTVRRKQGAFERAAVILREAIATARQLGDRYAEAPAWRELALALREGGHAALAADAFAAATQLYDDLGMAQELARTRALRMGPVA